MIYKFVKVRFREGGPRYEYRCDADNVEVGDRIYVMKDGVEKATAAFTSDRTICS